MAKKVFVHKVKLPPAGEEVGTDIYVDDGGRWSAKIGLDSCDTMVLAELRIWIDKTVKRQRAPQIEYAPFIEIFQVKGMESSYSDKTPAAGVRFWFDIVLLSAETYEQTDHAVKGGEVTHFRLKKFAKVTRALTVVEDESRVPQYEGDRKRWEVYKDDGKNFWSRIVPFTAKRYQAVCAIRDKINELRERLDTLLVQTDGAADALDKMPITALLAAPEKL